MVVVRGGRRCGRGRGDYEIEKPGGVVQGDVVLHGGRGRRAAGRATLRRRRSLQALLLVEMMVRVPVVGRMLLLE